MKTPWFVSWEENPQARIVLFCLSYAGGNASFFRPWPKLLGPDIQVCPIELPGRWHRRNEQPLTHIEAVMEQLGPQLETCGGRPYAFFGYSMGALIGFEAARWLRRKGCPLPRRLFAAAAAAPDMVSQMPQILDLPDGPFIQALEHYYGGIPGDVQQEPDLLRAVLRTLRGDLQLLASYPLVEEPPLDVPFTLFAGDADVLVQGPQLAPWARHSTRSCESLRFLGGHFFIQQHLTTITATVRKQLDNDLNAERFSQ